MIRTFTVLFEDQTGEIRQTSAKGVTVDEALNRLAVRNSSRRHRVVLLLGVFEAGERVL